MRVAVMESPQPPAASSSTPVVRQQRDSKDGRAAGPCLRRVLAAGRQETSRCPSHGHQTTRPGLPRPLGFPWLPGPGSSISRSWADVGGKGRPVPALAVMLCHPWDPAVPIPSRSAPWSLGWLDHPGVSAGTVHKGKGCQGCAGTCTTCPGAVARPSPRQPCFPMGRWCSAAGCTRRGAGQCCQLPPPQTLVRGFLKAALIAASTQGRDAEQG